MPFYGGLDWGGTAHAVCVVDGAGQVVARIEARHDDAGLVDMVARLRKIALPTELPIAIERPSGLVVDALIQAGHPVIPIHPNVVKACRPRYRAAGGKSDPGDAYLLADVLRTDGHRFRPLSPMADEIKALRALVRGRDDLVAQRVALANQLRSLLEGFWPGAAVIFADIDTLRRLFHLLRRRNLGRLRSIALAFVARYPTPNSASRLGDQARAGGEKRLAGFMAQHAYCGRRSRSELLARLHAAPKGPAGIEAGAKGELVGVLAAVLERLVHAIAKLSVRIEQAVAELPDGQIVMSFPRAGRICAAQILAELGNVRERFQTEDQLAAEAGVAPVTHASGKSRGVVFRWACNKNLRVAITCFADNSRHASNWATKHAREGSEHAREGASIYTRARDRGCKHPSVACSLAHAVRILARAWVRVLWRAWQDGEAYDPAKHKATVRVV